MRRYFAKSCYLTVLTVSFFAWLPMPVAAEKLVIALLAQQTEPYQQVLQGFRQSLKKQGINVEYEVLNFDTGK